MKNTMQKWIRLIGGNMCALIIASCLLMMSGCHPLQQAKSETIPPYEKNFEIVGSEKDELIGSVNQAIFTSVDRSNENAEQVESGVFTREGVKVNLQPGRYSITGYPTGNIFVYDENGELITRETVGFAGVGSLTVDIVETYTIFADGGYDHVSFTPVPTQLATNLTSGIWEVGLDIEAGEYVVGNEHGLGYLEIHEIGKEPLLYEVIGGTEIGSSTRVKLTEGQKLRISRIPLVQFSRVEE